jgi:class 3 adenylate cyclase
MRGLRLRFRSKIFLALAALLCAALAATLVTVRDVATRRARADAEERFARAQQAFLRLQSLRTRFVADAVDGLAASNAQFRTVLSTASVAAADLGLASGFAAPGAGAAEAGGAEGEEALRDANLRLRSLVPSLALARESDVFVVTSANAELLYAKTDPERAGDDLSGLPLLRAAASGEPALALWSRAEDVASAARLAPEPPPAALYEVVAQPVVFGEEVHGVVLAGRRVDRARLEEVRAISGLHVALLAPGAAPLSTLPDASARELAVLGDAGAKDSGERVLGGERFLAGRARILPGVADGGPHFLLLAPLADTLAFLRAVERTLLGVGAAVVAAALAVGFGLARGITRPVATLADAAARVGRGDLGAAVTIRTGDELEALGERFNAMVQGLRERDRIRHTFERHVSKPVAEEILRRPDAVRRAGERREVSVLFVDLGGFSRLAEASEPETVVARLGEYFAAVCEEVLAFDGTVNELLGDGMLAFFGAPIAQPDHARRACLAALRCRERLERLTARWRAEGLADLRFRIGAHTGPAVVGEMGTSERAKYGAIGDTVNLASRIEGANRHYGTRVLVSGATRFAAGDTVLFRAVDRVRVVGREGAVELFEPLAPAGAPADPARLDACARYEAALAAYRAGDFAAAEASWRALAADLPEDGPTRALLARVAALRAAPPAGAFDGVTLLDGK